MSKVSFHLFLCIGILLGVAGVTDTESAQAIECPAATHGNPADSCDALTARDASNSSHGGDEWIMCEVDSGKHGFAGQGVADFYLREAIPYWDDEISRYLAALKLKLTPKRFSALMSEHEAWLRRRQKMERAAQKEYAQARREGTMFMAMAAMGSADLPRRRALVLGCRLEKLVPSK